MGYWQWQAFACTGDDAEYQPASQGAIAEAARMGWGKRGNACSLQRTVEKHHLQMQMYQYAMLQQSQYNHDDDEHVQQSVQESVHVNAMKLPNNF